MAHVSHTHSITSIGCACTPPSATTEQGTPKKSTTMGAGRQARPRLALFYNVRCHEKHGWRGQRRREADKSSPVKSSRVESSQSRLRLDLTWIDLT